MANQPVGSFPGMVTSNIVGSTQHPMSIQDQATAYALQRRMKEDREREWANAAANNNARMGAYNLMFRPSSGRRPNPTWTTGSTVQAGNPLPRIPGFQGPIRWAPPGMSDAQLGTTVNQANKASMAKGEVPAIFLRGSTMPRS